AGAVGHVRGALDVAGEGVPDTADLAHRRVERGDGGSGQAERLGGALLDQDLDARVHCAHASRDGVVRGSREGEDGGAYSRPESSAVSLKRPEWSRPPSPRATSEVTNCATAEPSGTEMPAPRAAAVTMPRSLLCRARRNP